MKVQRRLRRRIATLRAEKLALLRELFALQKFTNEVLARLDDAHKFVAENAPPVAPPTEADMQAMRQRHHAFMAMYGAQQQKGEA